MDNLSHDNEMLMFSSRSVVTLPQSLLLLSLLFYFPSNILICLPFPSPLALAKTHHNEPVIIDKLPVPIWQLNQTVQLLKPTNYN